jgi:hypothetical protein
MSNPMEKATAIAQITENLKKLPDDKLQVVEDFVAYLLERRQNSESWLTMLASEHTLKTDWNNPNEDEAWRDL